MLQQLEVLRRLLGRDESSTALITLGILAGLLRRADRIPDAIDEGQGKTEQKVPGGTLGARMRTRRGHRFRWLDQTSHGCPLRRRQMLTDAIELVTLLRP